MEREDKPPPAFLAKCIQNEFFPQSTPPQWVPLKVAPSEQLLGQNGVYTTQSIEEYTIIGKYTGDLIWTAREKNLSQSLFVMPTTIWEHTIWIDGKSSYAGKINHKWNPPWGNIERTIWDKYHEEYQWLVGIFATVQVAKNGDIISLEKLREGQEIFLDYGVDYWRDIIRPIWNLAALEGGQLVEFIKMVYVYEDPEQTVLDILEIPDQSPYDIAQILLRDRFESSDIIVSRDAMLYLETKNPELLTYLSNPRLTQKQSGKSLNMRLSANKKTIESPATHIFLDFVYEPKLQGKPEEHSPVLDWRTSAWSGSGRTDYSKPDPSGHGRVSIPIDPKHAAFDDSLFVEALSWTRSDLGVPMRIRSGTTFFILKVIAERISKGEPFEMKNDMILYRAQGIHKGSIWISVPSSAENRRALAPWVNLRQEEGELSFSSAVELLHSSTTADFVPFMRGLGFSSKELEMLQVQNWQNFVEVPIQFYWFPRSTYLADERFMNATAIAALKRKGISEEMFLGIAGKQLRRTNDVLDDRYLQVLTATVLCIKLLAISLPYKTDMAYTNDPENPKLMIESFNDELRMLGGDCEDSHKGILKVARILFLGRPELLNVEVSHTRFGGWENPLLSTMQHVMYAYLYAGTLATVNAARAGLAPTETMQRDSPEDIERQKGGHAFVVFLPWLKQKEAFEKSSPGRSIPFDVLRPGDSLFPEWHKKLPVLVGEGTAWVHPLSAPLAMYFDETQGEVQKMHNVRLKAIDVVKQEASLLLALGSFEGLPPTTKQLPEGARVSQFVRENGTFITDAFLYEGFALGKFAFMEEHEDRWTFGTNFGSVVALGEKDEPWTGFRRAPILAVLAPELSDAIGFAATYVLRHFPSTVYPTLTRKVEWSKREVLGKIVEDLNDFFFAMKKEVHAETSLHRMVIAFHHLIMLHAKVGEEGKDLPWVLKETIAAAPSIMEARAYEEILADEVANIVLELQIAIPPQTPMPEDLSLFYL